jgi:hypothetical protein
MFGFGNNNNKNDNDRDRDRKSDNGGKINWLPNAYFN